jgi:hypothetical protein
MYPALAHVGNQGWLVTRISCHLSGTILDEEEIPAIGYSGNRCIRRVPPDNGSGTDGQIQRFRDDIDRVCGTGITEIILIAIYPHAILPGRIDVMSIFIEDVCLPEIITIRSRIRFRRPIPGICVHIQVFKGFGRCDGKEVRAFQTIGIGDNEIEMESL